MKKPTLMIIEVEYNGDFKVSGGEVEQYVKNMVGDKGNITMTKIELDHERVQGVVGKVYVEIK